MLDSKSMLWFPELILTSFLLLMLIILYGFLEINFDIVIERKEKGQYEILTIVECMSERLRKFFDLDVYLQRSAHHQIKCLVDDNKCKLRNEISNIRQNIHGYICLVHFLSCTTKLFSVTMLLLLLTGIQ